MACMSFAFLRSRLCGSVLLLMTAMMVGDGCRWVSVRLCVCVCFTEKRCRNSRKRERACAHARPHATPTPNRMERTKRKEEREEGRGGGAARRERCCAGSRDPASRRRNTPHVCVCVCVSVSAGRVVRTARLRRTKRKKRNARESMGRGAHTIAHEEHFRGSHNDLSSHVHVNLQVSMQAFGATLSPESTFRLVPLKLPHLRWPRLRERHRGRQNSRNRKPRFASRRRSQEGAPMGGDRYIHCAWRKIEVYVRGAGVVSTKTTPCMSRTPFAFPTTVPPPPPSPPLPTAPAWRRLSQLAEREKIHNVVEHTAAQCGALFSSPFRLFLCRLTTPSCAGVQLSPHRYRRHHHHGSGPRDGAHPRCPRHAVSVLRAPPLTRHGRRCGARRPPTGRHSRTDAADGHY